MKGISMVCLVMTGTAILAAFTVQISVPMWRRLFVARGVIDLPDGVRKLHRGAIPRAGGAAVMSAYVLSLTASLVLEPTLHIRFLEAVSPWMSVVPALLTIFMMGVADDMLGLRPRFKLSVQVFAAGIAVVPTIVLSKSHLSVAASVAEILCTMFWLVLTTNAFNLIDGMDGLASGLALIAAIALSAAAFLNGSTPVLFALFPLAGALASFLRFNFHQASVFLGDSGSYSIGFLLGWCSLACISGQRLGSIWPLVPIMICALPLLDVLLAVWRRFLRARPLFAPDRGHLHHRILALGFGPRRSALILYAIATFYAVCALAVVALPQLRFAAMAAAAVLTVLLAGILSYEEIAALGATLRRPVVRDAVASELAIRSAEASMRAARNRVELWAALQTASREMGFCAVQIEDPCGGLESRSHAKPTGPTCLQTPCTSCSQSCAIRVRLKDGAAILLYHWIERPPRVNSFALAAALKRGWSIQPDIQAISARGSMRKIAHMQLSTQAGGNGQHPEEFPGVSRV